MNTKKTILHEVAETQKKGARLSSICKFIGISSRTIQRWKTSDLLDQRKGSKRYIPHKLTKQERQQVIDISCEKEYRDLYPNEIVAILASKSVYIASESTFYRILKEERMLSHRRKSKPPAKKEKPTVVATGPDQVYSWDITWLKTDVMGIYYYLYMVIDIWSRMIVHWEIHERESSELAGKMLQKLNGKKNLQGVTLHSDNGSPMKGYTMLSKMYALNVLPSFSRPRVSEDNPYSESLFKTLKYRPLYPGKFSSTDEANLWVKDFVHWYNYEHMHSGISYVTPFERHYGKDIEILETRRETYLKAYENSPGRWSRKPKTWEQKKVVGINYQQDKKEINKAS